jgi:pentatricopeptide repeat protein
MLSFGLKVLKGTALKAPAPSIHGNTSIKRCNPLKIKFFCLRTSFGFSELRWRQYCSTSHFSADKYPIEADIDDHWQGDNNDVLLFAEQSEKTHEDLRFMPGEIFRDERLIASESSNENVDTFMASMETSPENLDQFVLLLRRYAKTNQWERIERQWNAQFGEESETNFEPDYLACMLLMRSFAERDGKYGDAQQLMHTMAENNIAPTAETYAYYILATVRDDQATAALNLFEKAKDKAFKWQLHDIRVLMRALSVINLEASQFLSMVEPLIENTIQTAQEGSPDAPKPSKRTKKYYEAVKLEMFGIALSKALSLLDMDQASEHASKIIVDTKTPLFTNTIAHVARWYITKGQFKEARDFINHAVLKDRAFGSAGLQHPTMMPPRLSILLLDLSIQSVPRNQKKSATRAILPQFYALFESYGARDALSLSNFMLRALLTQGLYSELFEVAKRVESALGSAASLTSVYNMKMRAYLYMNQFDQVIAQFANMQDQNSVHKPNPHTSTVIVSLAAKHHGSAAARQLLEQIIETVGVPLIGAFRAVIAAYCSENRADLASEVVQLMQRHGIRVTWALHMPIMEVYERMNLLGKQFALYHELLTKTLANDVPSPEMTTKLIFGCIRQGFIKVGLSVANAVETRRIPLSLGLVASLVELYQHAGMKDKLLQMAEFAEAKMISCDGSSQQNVKFANLAIRAYSYCGYRHQALKVFEAMKEKKLPLSVNTLNAVMSLYIRQNRIRQARELFANCEAEFGPHVASLALKHPTTTAILFSIAPASEWPQIKAKWQRIVEATRIRRAAAESRRASLLSSQKLSSDPLNAVSSAEDEVVEEISTGEREEVNFSEIEESMREFVDDFDIAAESNSSAIPEPIEVSHQTVRDYAGVPNATSKLAETILLLAHQRMSSESKWILNDFLPTCESFGLVPSYRTYMVKAQAQIQLNLEQPLLKTLQAMYDAHVNMKRDFYHGLLFEATKVAHYRHRLALSIFGFMKNRSGKTSEGPDQKTWTLLFASLSPKLLGLYLQDYLEEGYPLDAQLQHSIARSLLIYQTPIDAAINDTFVLLESMASSAMVIPTKETLHVLLTAVMKHNCLKIWKVHFFQLISRLQRANALQWPDEEFRSAIHSTLKHSLATKQKRLQDIQKALEARELPLGDLLNDEYSSSSSGQKNLGTRAQEHNPSTDDSSSFNEPNPLSNAKNQLLLPKDPMAALEEAFKLLGVKKCESIILPHLQPYKLNLSPNHVPSPPKMPHEAQKVYKYPALIAGYTTRGPNLPKPKRDGTPSAEAQPL